jgi:hypothetical protein
MTTDCENVCLLGQTGSGSQTVKTTLLTQTGHSPIPLERSDIRDRILKPAAACNGSSRGPTYWFLMLAEAFTTVTAASFRRRKVTVNGAS